MVCLHFRVRHIFLSLIQIQTCTHTHRGEKKGSCYFIQVQRAEKPQQTLHVSFCAVSGQDYHREQNMQRVIVRNVHTCQTSISHWKSRNRKRLSLLKKIIGKIHEEKKKKKKEQEDLFLRNFCMLLQNSKTEILFMI